MSPTVRLSPATAVLPLLRLAGAGITLGLDVELFGFNKTF